MAAAQPNPAAGFSLPQGNTAKIAILAQLYAGVSLREQPIDRIGAALTLIANDLCASWATPQLALEAVDALADDLRDHIMQEWGLQQ